MAVVVVVELRGGAADPRGLVGDPGIGRSGLVEVAPQPEPLRTGLPVLSHSNISLSLSLRCSIWRKGE